MALRTEASTETIRLHERKGCELYDNKICTGEESAQCRGCLARRMESIGYRVVTCRGDIIR